MNKGIGDILSVGKEEEHTFNHLYSIIEFTVRYFKVGDFVAYDDAKQYLWNEENEWTDDFLPSGSEIKEYKNGKSKWDHHGMEWTEISEDGLVLDKETFAVTEFEIVGNTSGSMTAMEYEIDSIGAEFLDPCSQEILQIVRSLPKPREGDDQYSTVLTLWKVVYETYNSYESMYPEYDVWAELLGAIDLNKLADSNCFLEAHK